MHALLFKQKEKTTSEKKAAKIDKHFIELEEPILEGDRVKIIKNRQIGVLKEIRGKNAIVQVGMIPITVNVKDLVKVMERVDLYPEKK
jgi:DNA mismatch repair protein MutS2